MNLEQIMGRPGCEDIATLVKGWRRVSQRQKGRELKVPLPNYYLNADEGFDFDSLFLLLGEELEDLELMEFDGQRKVYSFFLKYSPAEQPEFNSFRMLYDVVEHELSKFGHSFGGILVVDITEWVELGHTSDAKFVDFLSYMDTIDDRTMIVFLDRSGGGVHSDDAFRKLDVGMRIERLFLSYKDVDVAIAYLKEELARYGFSLEKDFDKKIVETVETVLSTPGSEGEESIRQMAMDMAYLALKSEEDVGFVLNEKNSAAFLPDGDWTKTFLNKPRKRLGLVGGDK
ncbi:MAG: hypothetical protein IJS52_03985 [Bacilli bacterium]|nr:hypothetical protein [Bacilli bacterium]